MFLFKNDDFNANGQPLEQELAHKVRVFVSFYAVFVSVLCCFCIVLFRFSAKQ